MEAHHEAALKRHLNTLSAADLENAKAHAHLATDEDHKSAVALKKWVGGVLGIVVAPGMIFKAIKVIKNH